MEKQISMFDPPSKEQKLTQCMKIVKYMNDFGSITPVQAMQDLGVMRLAAMISDLEAEGWNMKNHVPDFIFGVYVKMTCEDGL